MSNVALGADVFYSFPVHSGSALGFASEKWEEAPWSGLGGVDVYRERVDRLSTHGSVAQSIADFERLIRQVLSEFYRQALETQPPPVEFDVEREVIAHLPPKRVFETTLQVRYVGRARPNITLEFTHDDLWET